MVVCSECTHELSLHDDRLVECFHCDLDFQLISSVQQLSAYSVPVALHTKGDKAIKTFEWLVCRIPECHSRGRRFRPSHHLCHLAERTQRLEELKCPPGPGAVAGMLVGPGPTPVSSALGLPSVRPLSSIISFHLDSSVCRLWVLPPLHVPGVGAGPEGQPLAQATEG